ncbi:hypothetical protein [Nostoc sp.]
MNTSSTLTLLTSETSTTSYFDGEFDALIGLLPQTTTGAYWQGYTSKLASIQDVAF